MKSKETGFPGSYDTLHAEPNGHLVDIMTSQMVDMVYYKDKDFRYIYSSKPHCERVLKCAQGECLGKTDVEIAKLARSREHAQGFGEMCINSDRATRENRCPSQFIEKAVIDGEEIVLEVYKTPLFNEKGVFEGIVGCSRDITDRMKMEEVLKESEAKYRSIFELSPETIVTLDKDGVILDINHRAFDILGFKPEELIGKHLSVLPIFPAHSKTIIQEKFVQRMGGKEVLPYEVDFISKDGETRIGSISSNIMMDSDGNITGGVVIVSDVTERKRAAEELQCAHDDLELRVQERAQELFSANEQLVREIAERKRTEEALKVAKEFESSILRGIPYAVLGLQERVIIFANEAVEAVFGWKHDELIGKSTKMFHRNEEEYREIGRRFYFILEKQATYSEELPFRHRTGKEIICRVSAVRLGGDLTEKRVVAVYEDITYHKNMEKELIKIRNLESIGILAGGVAHDFNNLLTVIMGNISLARMSNIIDKRTYDKLGDSENACLKAKDLTQLLLTFSRGGGAHKTFVDIDNLVRDSVYIALLGSHVRCEFEIESALFPVVADDRQLHQVMRNIVANAREAMGEKGLITVRTRNVIVSSHEPQSLPDGNYVEIAIQDRGTGIREEDLARIFDPYFTNKAMGPQRGLGLGLAICYSIVKNHGGRITVDSKVEVGTTFRLYLPASKEESVAAEKSLERPNATVTRILVVDEKKTLRGLVKIMLEQMDYVVATAKDNMEAIALSKQAHAAHSPFDVVILDLTLLEGKGGRDILNDLNRIDPQTKTIVSVENHHDPALKDFREYGFTDAITKPFKLEELQEVLLRVTDKKP